MRRAIGCASLGVILCLVLIDRVPARPRGVGRCSEGQVALRGAGRNGGSGHELAYFLIRNDGRQSCRLGGYPSVALFGRHGHRLRVRVERSPSDYFGSFPVRRVILRPKGHAVFRVMVVSGDPPGSCATVRSIRLVLPGQRRRHLVRELFFECGHYAHVSPVVAGTHF